MADDVMPWDIKYAPSPVQKSAPPPVAKAVPAAAVQNSDSYDVEFEKEKARMQKEAADRTVALPQATPLLNDSSWLSPPALIGMGALGTAAAIYAGSKAKPIVKRWLSGQGTQAGVSTAEMTDPPLFAVAQPTQATDLNEPPMFRQTPAQSVEDFEPPMSRTAAPSQNLTIQEAQARMAGVTPAAGEFVGPMQPVGPPEFIGPRQPVVPSAAKQAALADYESKIAASNERINQLLAAQQQNDEFIRANNAKIANQNAAPSAAPNSAATKAVTDTIQQLGQEESAIAGAAMPSRPVAPTPPAALASTTAPVAPVVPPTGELRTGAGLPAYAGEGKQYQRMPKEFPSVKEVPAGYAFVPGVGPGTNTIRNLETPEGYKAAVQLHGGPFGSHDEAVAFMNKYNAEQRMGPPADRTLRKSLGLPLQENTKGIAMKAAKVGGVVGAIMAIPDLANAAQNRDVGQAANVASSFLPPALQALIYSGGLNAGAEEEARQLRMRDYALKAGRGVAQGYDPRQLIGVAPPTR